MSTKLNHLAYAISDFGRTQDWCVEVLGATPLLWRKYEGDFVIGFVDVVGTKLEFVQSRTSSVSYDLEDNLIGAYHICLETGDVAAAYARLTELGVEMHGFAGGPKQPVEVRPNAQSFFFRDPDGSVYEATGPPESKAKTGEGRFGRVHHVSFNVTSIEQSLSWYSRVFGLAPNGHPVQTSSDPSRSFVLLPIEPDFLIELKQWRDSSGTAGLGPVHLGFEVADVESMHDRLVEEGEQMLIPFVRNEHAAAPVFGRTYFMVADPDGLAIQTVEGFAHR